MPLLADLDAPRQHRTIHLLIETARHADDFEDFELPGLLRDTAAEHGVLLSGEDVAYFEGAAADYRAEHSRRFSRDFMTRRRLTA